MAPKVERVTESSQLGEGPHWDIPTQSLYYVDIFGKKILKYTPLTGKVTKVSVAPARPSFIIPVEGKKGQFVASLEKDLVILTWDGQSDEVTIVETLATLGEESINNFNDGKVDPAGRLWAGSLHIDLNWFSKTLPIGTLYSLDSTKVLKPHVGKIKVANGLAFNEKEKKFYYIDSLKGTVDQYDYDSSTGTISNPRVFFSFEKNNITGFPDGQAIDADGNLWVANFGGGRVLKIDGRKPDTLLETVELPAKQVTSVAFGGPNLDELYVTTGSVEFKGEDPPQPPPIGGAVYKVTGLGVKGLPADNFKL